MENGERDKERIPVVIVVDIDDDLGEVLGKSLIVGEENIKKAVTEYGVRRPTDPDVNALLAGLNLYARFKEEGRRPVIIAVGGHRTDFLTAQRLIKERVRKALEKVDGKPEFYIVSDGEDEFIISQVLHDIGTIGGFKRVIVEQSLDIEGRYLLILKYLKKAAFDPRFSKYFLGIPGIAIAVFSLLSLIGYAYVAAKATALVIGLAMIARGFNLEEPIEAWIARFVANVRERPHLQLGGLTILLLAVLASAITARQSLALDVSSVMKLAYISRTSIPLLLAGVSIYLLIAGVFYKLVYEVEGILTDVAAIAATIMAAVAFYQLGDYIIEFGVNEFSVSLFVDSGFVQFMISGTGIAAIIEMARRVKERGREGKLVKGEVGGSK
ncbi:MAG: DUF373 family protein [Desulfurococcales archaeon]|nr:DUF373 family protein [Desulfurococcales archaeon]